MEREHGKEQARKITGRKSEYLGEHEMNTPVEKGQKKKRPSKGMRKHNRKVKQEERKAYVPTTPGKKKPS
jgi:hypothetical protein